MESHPNHLIKYELDISRYLYVSSVINLGFIIEFDEVLLKLQQIIQYMYCISGYFLKKKGGGYYHACLLIHSRSFSACLKG